MEEASVQLGMTILSESRIEERVSGAILGRDDVFDACHVTYATSTRILLVDGPADEDPRKLVARDPNIH